MEAKESPSVCFMSLGFFYICCAHWRNGKINTNLQCHWIFIVCLETFSKSTKQETETSVAFQQYSWVYHV